MSHDNGNTKGCGGRVLYCRCAYARVVPEETKRDVLNGLAASGEPFEAVADLCEMSARRDGRMKGLAEAKGLRIIACYERAVRGLFEAAGTPLPDDAAVLNMRTESAGAILSQLTDHPTAAAEHRHHGVEPGGNGSAKLASEGVAR